MSRLCLFLLLISCLFSATIQDVIVKSEENNTKVIIQADGIFTANTYSLKDPPRIVVDVTNATLGLSGLNYPDINRGGISKIVVNRFEKMPNLIRIVISLDQDYSFLTAQEDNNYALTILTSLASPVEEWHASLTPGVSFTPPPTPETTRVAVPTPPPQTITRRPERLVSMDMENADLLTILRALAEYSGMNIVVGKGVSGNVTVRLHNVPWRQALEIILKSSGYAYREEGRVIRVDTGENLEKQDLDLPLVSRVYKLEFADPSEVANQVGRLISSKGKATPDARTNSIVVYDVEPVQEKVFKLISILDSPTPQVEIAVRVIDIDAAISRGLGIRWTVRGLQSRIVQGDITLNRTPAVAGYGVFNIGTVPNLAHLNATLQIMESEGKTKTIAAPRITAVNNRTASILGGKKFSVTVLDERGNPIVQFFEVGTKLNVTPHINSLEEITMDIKAEVSEVDEASVTIGRPIITTSEATSKVLVRDGNTVVIGGFIKQKEEKSVKGIPILRSIPIIGILFKETATTRSDRELLIFITPTIVKSS
ncbi:MAG: AMIN domain-containing protein [candidate division WOR-3 bacterium]